MIINTQEQLENLPDGTIITWLRIPDDPTSEAVAFVRVETAVGLIRDMDGVRGDVHQVTWISPGGWAPMSIEDAGITYPVTAFEDPSSKLNITTIDQGGTWSREKALECASRAVSGVGPDVIGTDDILALAEHMERWLDRAPETSVVDGRPWPGLDITAGQVITFQTELCDWLVREGTEPIAAAGIASAATSVLVTTLTQLDEPPMSEDDAEAAMYLDLKYLADEQDMANTSAVLALALARRGWRK